MSSVLSANTAPNTIRVVAPAALRPADGAPATARDTPNAPAEATAAKTTGPAPSKWANARSTPAGALTKTELAREVRALQEKMDKLNPALAFVLDQDSGRALIQLTDRITKEVIQQFPTEAAMQISKALDQFEKGQLIHITV